MPITKKNSHFLKRKAAFIFITWLNANGQLKAVSGVLTWGFPEQSGPANVGQQVVNVGGRLHVLRVHRRLERQTQSPLYL